MILICALVLANTNTAIANESVPAATAEEHLDILIAEYFPQNFKVMKAIAHCESGGKHRNPDGTLVANAGTARGAFQLLMRIHAPEMKRLGLDPNNDDDYMTYVRRLYDAQGLAPWADSKRCWKHKVA